jgi:beta-glucosidase
MGLARAQLNRLTEPSTFLWCTGIEDTFITEPWPATGRTLDEYELTGHYDRWQEDLNLISELGVGAARYGIPWHRINPAPNQWDWSCAEGPLQALVDAGIEPIVDLVHYGLPDWIHGAFAAPDCPERVAEFASRIAERFIGRIHCYTPLNEPRVTAWYCGKLGWWPPAKKGWRGFVSVMLAVCRGVVRTVEALQAVDDEIVPVHVDATDLYESEDPALAPEVERRQEIVFLALDLISGRIDSGHSLWEWLLKNGATEEDLAWFQEHAVDLPVIGINLYPLFSRKVLLRSTRGLRVRMPYASADIIERLAHLYWARYRRPLMITETASAGSVRRRRAWLDSSVAAVRKVRAQGIPLVGYTWWPLFALVTWAYRQGRNPPAYYLKQMGLWNLDAELTRVRTPLVDAYKKLVAGGTEHVGLLGRTERVPAYV